MTAWSGVAAESRGLVMTGSGAGVAADAGSESFRAMGNWVSMKEGDTCS
jgi:NAD-dependent SIR2 family protein deacetylase